MSLLSRASSSQAVIVVWWSSSFGGVGDSWTRQRHEHTAGNQSRTNGESRHDSKFIFYLLNDYSQLRVGDENDENDGMNLLPQSAWTNRGSGHNASQVGASSKFFSFLSTK